MEDVGTPHFHFLTKVALMGQMWCRCGNIKSEKVQVRSGETDGAKYAFRSPLLVHTGAIPQGRLN